MPEIDKGRSRNQNRRSNEGRKDGSSKRRSEMDNIPEFYETEEDRPDDSEYGRMKARYDRLKENEHARHGAAMFATGVIEGLRQAIHAIETDRRETQPSHKWPGMNAAIAAVERTITQRQAEKQSS